MDMVWVAWATSQAAMAEMVAFASSTPRASAARQRLRLVSASTKCGAQGVWKHWNNHSGGRALRLERVLANGIPWGLYSSAG